MNRREALSLLSAAVFAGCQEPGESDSVAPAPALERKDRRPIQVLVTTGMVKDIVERVGGPEVDVKALMGPGVDPHLYKASPGDVRLFIAADLVVYSGLHLEGKLTEVLHRLQARTPTHALADSLPRERLLRLEGNTYDPHVWFDVALWSQTLTGVCDLLSRYDPPRARDYAERAERSRRELRDLDDECRRSLAEIPPSRRVLVTPHDAFSYFGRAYDVEIRALQGVSTESEAGVFEVNELVDFLVQRSIRSVFVESTTSDRNVRALVEGCASRGHQLVIGGELFSDGLGPIGGAGDTYVGMVRHNVNAIKRGLS